MKNVKKAVLAACMTVVACGPSAEQPAAEGTQLTTAQQGQFLRADERIPGEYIVVLKEKPSAAAADIRTTASALAKQYAAQVTLTYQHALRGFVIRASEAQARALASNPQVEYVQENGVVHLNATQYNPPSWGLDRIDQESLPLNGQYVYDTEASNVHVYVIDTGIRDTHAEFEGRADRVFDSINDGQNGMDCNGHGTHVAGTVGGKSFGVAKKVRLHGVRVLSCSGSGSYAGVIAGVDWVTGNAQKPAVANMSLGGGAHQAVDDAVTRSIDSGVVYTIAAGNSSLDACNSSPARTPKAVTVGSSESNDARAAYSNYGTCLDLFAPGTGISSAWNGSDTDTRSISGTSMAAPHVAGAAALLLAKGVSAANVPAQLVNDALQGKVTNPGTGSPNRLLFTGSRGNGALVNGVAVMGLSDAAGGQKNFYMDVPAGLSRVTFNITGGSGDADLYVRYNAVPTTTDYDCRPLRAGNEEVCTMFDPAPGRWHVQLRAYSNYANVTLKGAY